MFQMMKLVAEWSKALYGMNSQKTITLSLAVLILGPLSGQQVSASEAEKGTLKITITEAAKMKPIPCRFRIYEADNRSPMIHEVCDGNLELALQPGQYRVVVSRGHEYIRGEKLVIVEKGKTLESQIELRRFINLTEQGWWSGETHVHLRADQMKLHMAAEDLHVATVINWWGGEQRAQVEEPLVCVGPDRVCDMMVEEHEHWGNAVIYFNIKPPVPLLRDENMVAGLKQMKQRGAWAEIEKPYIWDTPALLATGLIDSIEIAPNTLSWYLESDFTAIAIKGIKWGRLPGYELRKYPGYRRTIGFYIQDIYYRILNCGFRIPPSAGTAVGVMKQLDVGLGYNRVYVYLPDGFSYERWWEQLAGGRCFVTNGPILFVKANGALPGEVFHSKDRNGVEIHLDINIGGNEPIECVEIIRDGKIAQRIQGDNLTGKISSEPIVFNKSGWFLVRAIADVDYDNLVFASTAPFYVEVGTEPKTIHAGDVKYMLSWIDERINMIKKKHKDRPKQEYLLRPQYEAKAFYERLIQKVSSNN
jgi:hypothetical protein